MADYVNRVSPNFAEFLLENANNGAEILTVLDDIVEVEDTALYVTISKQIRGQVVDSLPIIL